MKRLKPIIYTAAIIVFLICLFAFLLGTGVFEGKFKNDPFSWYFLAKGIFCSLSLFLSIHILEAIQQLSNKH